VATILFVGIAGLHAPASLAQAGAEVPLFLAQGSGARDRQTISPNQAVAEAQGRYGGKVLSVRLQRRGNQPAYYLVKLLSQGNVRVVRIPAQR
jgi:uncharacterized membrane protein YkoI